MRRLIPLTVLVVMVSLLGGGAMAKASEPFTATR